MYKYGSDTIGNSLEETIGFLKDPRNQDVKIGILSAADAKDYYVKNEAPVSELQKSVNDKIETLEKKIKTKV
jgi:hypothetical protein